MIRYNIKKQQQKSELYSLLRTGEGTDRLGASKCMLWILYIYSGQTLGEMKPKT